MTGWAKWEDRQLPSSSHKIINWRNYWHIPDKTAKIRATLPTYKMESKGPCPTANMKVILGTTLGGHPLTLVAMPTAVSTPEVVILLEQVKLPLAPGQGYSISKCILPRHHKAGTYLHRGIEISSCSPSGCSPNGLPIVNFVGHHPDSL